MLYYTIFMLSPSDVIVNRYRLNVSLGQAVQSDIKICQVSYPLLSSPLLSSYLLSSPLLSSPLHSSPRGTIFHYIHGGVEEWTMTPMPIIVVVVAAIVVVVVAVVATVLGVVTVTVTVVIAVATRTVRVTWTNRQRVTQRPILIIHTTTSLPLLDIVLLPTTVRIAISGSNKKYSYHNRRPTPVQVKVNRCI
jgi:hypothetical protein